jgi:hypothetical protein
MLWKSNFVEKKNNEKKNIFEARQKRRDVLRARGFDVARGDLRQLLRCSCIPRHSFAFATADFAPRSRGTPRAELQPRAL